MTTAEASMCLAMGWTQRQLYEENTIDFLNALAFLMRTRAKR